MTQHTAIPVSENIEEAPQCMHYWEIQPATGPFSPGICRTCGETRDFKNYVEGASWGDTRLSNRSGGDESNAVSKVVAGRTDDDEEEE